MTVINFLIESCFFSLKKFMNIVSNKQIVETIFCFALVHIRKTLSSCCEILSALKRNFDDIFPLLGYAVLFFTAAVFDLFLKVKFSRLFGKARVVQNKFVIISV